MRRGNANANDGECTLSCSLAVCGDGLIHANLEQCDNGGLNANDAACKSDCTDNYCGDGFAGPGEACDDGNANNTDACLNTCEVASCGDGVVWANNEVCDDGNMQDADGCESNCTLSLGPRKVLVGSQHTCLLFWSGGVKCWGWGAVGSLGRGNPANIGDNELPSAIGLIDFNGETVVDMEVGGSHSCALMNNGTLRCWGYNNHGQLGYGHLNNIGDDEGPGGPVSVGANIVAFSLGSDHTCVLTDEQTVRCWGFNQWGQLGYGHTNDIGDNELPSSVGTVDVGGPVVALSAAAGHTCAILDDGTVRCWGVNNYGVLGYGNVIQIGDDELPSTVGAVSLGNTPIVKLVAASHHNCVLYDDNTMRCWGGNQQGQLGYGNTLDIGDTEVPSSVGPVSVGGLVDDIMLGWRSTCVRMGINIKCWGYGFDGQNGYASTAHLGDNELPSSYGPVTLGVNVTQMAINGSGHHNCALSGANLRCWGHNGDGRLGYGHTNTIGDDETPASAGNVSY